MKTKYTFKKLRNKYIAIELNDKILTGGIVCDGKDYSQALQAIWTLEGQPKDRYFIYIDGVIYKKDRFD